MEYEWNETLKDGHKVHIRPITPEDMEREQAFTKELSPESRYFWLLSAKKQLSTKELEDLCNIDYNHNMAFVATVLENGEEVQIGVSRYVMESTSDDSAEIAVAIDDNWRHLGLGQLLLQHLINYAKMHKIKRLYSIDLAYNDLMENLSQDFGFSVETDPQDTHQVIYSLDLTASDN
ncbi:MAG: GNAT family N-acetyltransferase [Exilibacterium sp.]